MRKAATEGSAGVNLGLIITPMLDMSFQILAFFIMTYHPSALEGHLAGTLAASGAAAGPTAVNATPPAIDPLQDADVVTVQLKTDGAREGRPDKLLLQRKTEPVPLQIADATTNWETARRTLERELRLARQGTEPSDVRIQADGDLRHEFVLQVYDTCKNAGFARIAFVAPPNSRR
jgi:biopolymer transport protein ExbD